MNKIRAPPERNPVASSPYAIIRTASGLPFQMHSWAGDLNFEKLLGEQNVVKIRFSIEETQKGMGQKKNIPITSGVKYIFLLTFSVAKRVSSLSKKLFKKNNVHCGS